MRKRSDKLLYHLSYTIVNQRWDVKIGRITHLILSFNKYKIGYVISRIIQSYVISSKLNMNYRLQVYVWLVG